MKHDVLQQADKYAKARQRKRRWYRVVTCLACVVVFCTTYALILPAITMEDEFACGLEEHTHNESCYTLEQVLTCQQEEAPSHVHDESCVQTEETLICTEEHEHTADCYEITETYVCGLTEGEGGHSHGPECYETREVLSCELEEHEHQLICFSDPEADLEGEGVWTNSVSGVELTGIWADDVIAIAKSQLGYEESTRNYIVTEDGEMKGITRYGQWYGDPYGDWCAMFASFCLNYAEIPESSVPYESSCPRWVQTLSDTLYRSAASYTPETGDILFLDMDCDGVSDHVGLVVELNDASLRVIEGDSADCVRYVSYDLNDSKLLGYAALPENPETGNSEATDKDAATENSKPSDEAIPTEEIETYSEDISYEVASVNVVPSDETISIHVGKQWAGDAAYLRPASVEVVLWINGTETDQKLTLTAENNWSGAFSGNFPKCDDGGNEIIYEVKETTVANYDLVSNTYTDTASPVDLSTLELWIPVTELEAGESYLAVSGLSGSQSVYRAESTVTNGVLSASVTVNEGSVRDQQGTAYPIYILLSGEDGQTGYLTWKAVDAGENRMNLQSNVYTFWNGNVRYLLSSSGKLTVGEDGAQPDAVFFSDEESGFITNESSTPLYFFKKVSLDTSSLPVPFYDREYTLVNRYQPAETTVDPQATSTSVLVTKIWDDLEDHSADTVTVWLLRDGERTDQSAVLNAENSWTYTFSDLPIFRDAELKTEYVYDAEEEAVPSYQAQYQYKTDSAAGTAIWLPANSFEDGVTYLIVTSAGTGNVTGMEASNNGFAWTTNSGAGTILVESSEAYPRYISDEEAQNHTAMQWTAESLGLQKGEQVGSRYVYALKNVQYGSYAKNNGQGELSKDKNGNATWWYYGYTRIDEVGKEVSRYPEKTPESNWSYVLGAMNDYFLLTNNHTGDGGAQEAQTFYLYRRYEVQEPQLIVTVTNRKIEETSLTVLKDWINDDPANRPQQITIRLLANEEETGKTLILSADTEWMGTFEHLPVEDEAGNQISYTVAEDPVDGYITSYFYSSENGAAKVVISNRTQPMLPETGGTGTSLYTIGGLLLIAGASFLLLYNHIKRRKEDHASS